MNPVPIRLGSRTVGDGEEPYIAVECGATHGGRESLIRIAGAVAHAGANALKVQVVFADDLMLDPTSPTRIAYGSRTGPRSEGLYQALRRRELPWEDWARVKTFCDEAGLDFIATPSSLDGVRWLAEVKAAGIKIAKGDMTYGPLIEAAAATGLPVLLDGRERVHELAAAVAICRAAGSPVLVVHCPSGYPPERGGVHLAALPALRTLFPDYPIGYADHSRGIECCAAAVALGARYVEKGATETPDQDAVEHYISLPIGQVGEFTEAMHTVWAALGDPAVLCVSRVEPAHRRGVYAARELAVEERVTLEAVRFARPEGRCGAHTWPLLAGRKLRRALSQGDAVTEGDLGPPV